MTTRSQSNITLPSTISDVTKSPDQESSKSYWKNRTQHLFYFLAYCVNLRTLSSIIYEDRLTNPNRVPSIIQTILVCIIIAGPVVFIQNFIGQFTQKGCISIGAMLPAMYGFGFCMLIVSLLDAVQTLYYSGAGLLYMITSIMSYPYPAWMRCTKRMFHAHPRCLSREDIDFCVPCDLAPKQPCFKPGTRILSAKIFRTVVAFEKDLRIKDLTQIGVPQINSVLHVTFTILLVYFISCRRLKSLDWSIRFSLIFCFLGSMVSMVVIFSHAGFLLGVKAILNFDIRSLPDLTCWIAAYRRVTEALKISCGGHVILGSYMSQDTPSHFRVVYLIGYFLLVLVFYHIHYHLIEGLLRCRLNMEKYGVDSANDINFVMYATEYGLTATPQLWSTLHFTIYWILSVVSMVMQIVLIDETLSEEFKIGNYYLYTRSFIVAVIFILCLPMTTKGGQLVARVLAHELKIVNLFLITLMFIILFLYNIQRLKDDIHFVLNAPPTWYVQACWILTAFITGTMFLYQVWQYESDNRYYLVRLPLYVLIGSPIVVGFVVKTVQYTRRQNITGLFRPSIYYGAPDLNMRLLRLVYNPRLEVRYRRRKETCKHRCLLNNVLAVKVIERELLLLQQIAFDLQNNEEYRGEYSEIIAQLEQHSEVMNTRFTSLLEQLEQVQ